MSSDALVFMIVVQGTVTIVTAYFFFKVLYSKKDKKE